MSYRHFPIWLVVIGLLVETAQSEEIGGKESEESASPAEESGSYLPLPEERPRLFHPTDMHPYVGGGNLYLDPWFYGGYRPAYAYGMGGWGSPFGYGYGFGRGIGFGGWGYGYGYQSHLYYDTFYGILPAPGHTELSMSVGSNDYFGTSLSTSTYLSKKHNIVLNIGALWEQGEQWWNGQDYDSFTIAPSLYWSNENTFIYVGFQYTERNYAETVSNSNRSSSPMIRAQQRQRINPNSSDSSMSPFRNQIATQESDGNEKLYPEVGFRPDADHTIKSATIGIDHQITDSFRIGLNFEARDFDRKRN